MVTSIRLLVCALVAVGALVVSREARAENTFIISAEGGIGGFDEVNGVLQFRLGWGGNDPSTGIFVGKNDTPILFGVTAVSLTQISVGTDLAALGRMSIGDFAFGGWGGALEVGPYVRVTSPHSVGVLGEVVLGAPYGLQLSVWGEYGTLSNRALGVTAGIDFAHFVHYGLGKIVRGATGL